MKHCLLTLAFGLLLSPGSAKAGPGPGSPAIPASDGDAVEDVFDNCRIAPNANQVDTDHNGCGDACQPSITCDMDGDLRVGTPDALILGMNYGKTGVPVHTLGDCNSDGAVGTPDVLAFGMEIGRQVGPSGIHQPSICNPSTCRCTPQ